MNRWYLRGDEEEAAERREGRGGGEPAAEDAVHDGHVGAGVEGRGRVWGGGGGVWPFGEWFASFFPFV